MTRWGACALAAVAQSLVLLIPTALWGEPGRLVETETLVLLVVLGLSMLAEASVAGEASGGPKERRSRRLAQATGATLLLIHLLAVSGLGAWRTAPAAGPVLVGGATLVLIGAALRRGSVQTLGKHFRTAWTVRSEQPLITTGPFGWSRHPSELGLLLGAVGVLILSANVAAALAGICVLAPLTAFRIRAEDMALRRGFGPAYDRYATEVPALLGWRRPTMRTM